MNVENKDKKNKTILFILVIAVGFLLGIAIGYFAAHNASVKTEGGIGFTVVPENNLNNTNTEKGVTVPGITSMSVKAGSDRLVTGFYNPVENKDRYYLTFQLWAEINGKNELLYTSGLVEPGNSIYEIKLDKTLEKGTYNAVIHIQPYRMNKDLTPTNNADIKAVIKAV